MGHPCAYLRRAGFPQEACSGRPCHMRCLLDPYALSGCREIGMELSVFQALSN
jgi:hypothetical protein